MPATKRVRACERGLGPARLCTGSAPRRVIRWQSGSAIFGPAAHAGAVGALGPLGRLVGVFLHGLFHFLDGAVELGIAAVLHFRGVVDHLDVGVHAVALDTPGAVGLVEAEAAHRDGAAVDEAGVAGDAHQAAPGAHADQRAQLGLAEVEGEGVAAGAGEAVDEHALGALVAVGRPDPVQAVAPGPVVGHGAVEQLDEARGDLAAGVPALVDDERGLAVLAEELAEQLGLTVHAGVGNIDVTDLALGLVL